MKHKCIAVGLMLVTTLVATQMPVQWQLPVAVSLIVISYAIMRMVVSR